MAEGVCHIGWRLREGAGLGARVPSCPRCSTWSVDDGERLRCPNCGFTVGFARRSAEGRELLWRRAVLRADMASRRVVFRVWEG